LARAEEARAAMLALFPAGFEEVDRGSDVELAAYGDRADADELRARFGTVESAAVEPGWEDRWRDFHRGVRVGEIWVGPPWEEPPAGAVAVVVDPGRAFGTGAHPTTRLCLELLARVETGSLVDAGSGSGVLAVAAAKLGFAPVVAIDDDPAAIEATLRNADANGVALTATHADILTEALEADVVVANVSLEVVHAIAPRVRAQRLVTSGYLASDALELPGWQRGERVELDGWAADCWRSERE
jgi:ribosomal protein L11 methyltransferase